MTIEEMKKKCGAWYTYNGWEGILVDSDNEKFQDIESIEDGGAGDYSFYAFEDLSEIELLSEDVRCVLSDSYSVGCAELGGKIGNYLMTNPEWEQSSFYAWEYDDVHEDDEAVRELNTYTDQYYDWSSQLTKFTDAAIHNYEETKEELQKEWKEISNDYTFHFSEPLDFDKIWEVIIDSRDKENPDWKLSYIEEGVNYFTSEEEYHKEAEELEVDYYLDSENMADYKYKEKVFENDNEDSEPYKIYGLTKYENQFFVCTDNPEDKDMFFLNVSLEQVKKFLIYRS